MLMKPFTVSITYQTLRGNLAVAAYIIQSNTGSFAKKQGLRRLLRDGRKQHLCTLNIQSYEVKL